MSVPTGGILIGVTPRQAPRPPEALVAEGWMPSAGNALGWSWTARDNGKTISGWTAQTADTLDAEMLKRHLMAHLHTLDYTDFKCHPQYGPPQNIRPVQARWYEHGTRRMVAEFRAGLRPMGYTGPLSALPGYRPPPPGPRSLWERKRR